MQDRRYKRMEETDGITPLRAHVHDLRNLFAVVASAKYLLERPLAQQKLSAVIAALGNVAAEGTVLTNGLLLGGPSEQPEETDASQALRKLEPMLAALAGAERRIVLQIEDSPARVGITRSALEAVLLELVTNALSAKARSIVIRGALRPGHFWVLVSDDGKGFAQSGQAGRRRTGLHGTGLLRVAAAADSAQGSLHVRSKLGQGSIVALSLPVLPTREADVFEVARFAPVRPPAMPVKVTT